MIPGIREQHDPAIHAAAAPNPAPMAVSTFTSVSQVAPRTSPLQAVEPWLPLFYIGMITVAELAFIECYCHWHGAQFLLPNPFHLYSADNISKLSQIGFVGPTPPSVMGFTAEILMWASLGVWSQRISGMVARYRDRRPVPSHDLAEYIGILGCHTSIAAAVMIVLKLSGFKIFNISLDNFDATVGVAFVLGYFGDHTNRLLIRLRNQLFSEKNLPKNKQDH
jgi:hypothetical protein